MGDCEEGFILKSEEELGLTFPSPSLPAPAPAPATDIAPSPHPTIDSDPILVPAPAPATDIAPSPEPVTEVATIPAAIDSDLDPYLVPDPATDIVPFPDPASDPATDIVAPSPDPATDLATTRAIDSDIDPASDPNLVPAAQETFYGEFQSLGLEENRIEKNNEEENHNDDKNENENLGWDSPVEEEKGRRYQHPQGTDEEVCPHYIRTGTCKFGLKCRFNHPTKRKNQEKEKGWTGKLECKYYLSSGGCKFGKACRYNHPREKTVVGPPQGLNFLGLPIRLGGKECPFYMRTGSCKYGVECRFNHPDPTAAGECDPPSVYLHSAGASQPAVTSWSSPRTSIDAVPHLDAASSYVPVMPSPPQGVHPNSEWNGYQAPAYPIERSTHPPSALVMNNPTKQADFSRYQQQQMVVEEFPERPGQPECRHFVRTGYCKFRSGCKFHHPKNPAPKAPVRSQ